MPGGVSSAHLRYDAVRACFNVGKLVASGPRETSKAKGVMIEAVGMTVAAITQTDREELGIPTDVEGVIVTEIEPLSEAAEKQLLVGDVIVEYNGHRIAESSELPTRASSRTPAPHRRGRRRGQLGHPGGIARLGHHIVDDAGRCRQSLIFREPDVPFGEEVPTERDPDQP